jgi:hypothetical protein
LVALILALGAVIVQTGGPASSRREAGTTIKQRPFRRFRFDDSPQKSTVIGKILIDQ